MARIPEEEVERLKREVALERLVQAHGVELKRHGADLHGRCPFHEDKTPSLVVSPKKNLWHCLGACQRGGSVVDWVMKAEGVSFRHAVELLRDGRVATVPAGAAKASGVRRLPAPVEPDADEQQLLRQVVDYYHQELKKSPEALQYLERRGLKSMEMVERFRLGFSNRTLGLRLPMKAWKAGGELRTRLQRLGILRESGHEHLNGSLVIPILDEAGNVLGMYGRKVTPNLRAGTPLHLYLPGPHRGVWNLAALKANKTVILCEALLDALTFWAAGFRNVTTAYGVEGFTETHFRAFQESGTERVLIAYDRDEAGDRAAESLAYRLMGIGLECWRVQFPKGMDANDYALKVQPAAKALEMALRNAVWMGKGARPKLALSPLAAVLAPVHESAAAAPPASASAEEMRPADGGGERLDDLKDDATAAADVKVSDAEAAAGTGPAAEREAVESPPPGVPPFVPATKAPEVPTEVREEEVVVALGDRRYRVRGLGRNTAYEVLKVNVLVSREGHEGFHVDTLDVYAAKARAAYQKQAAVELGVAEEVVKHDLGKLLLKLEELQDAHIKQALAPKTKDVALTDEERQAALELLRSPNLLARILEDFEKCGVVGEQTNKLVGYLGAISRKLDEPLAIVIQSSSAAGKSSLMDAVLALVPEEDRVKYSAMTGQSLFYMGDTNLKHKVLAIAEEEGASRASYALKLLQSEGELTIASTGKDPATGELVTKTYRVEGPVMIFLTTTAIHVDEELLNRCLVLSVDEEREQTRAIHRLQRERQTLEGLLAKSERQELLKLHRNAQRLLRPLLVANPYARELTFVDHLTRTRRDHTKYLTLIRTLALLHQHQRPVKTVEHGGKRLEYVEATLEDIAVANRLAHQVLGRSLDELPPQTRRLLVLVEKMVAEACARQGIARRDYRFTRKDVRVATGWGDTQLKVHLARLEELEYLAVRGGGRNQPALYELVYDGKGLDGTPFLSGLLDVEQLRSREEAKYDGRQSGQQEGWSAGSRPAVGGKPVGSREGESDEKASSDEGMRASAAEVSRNARLELVSSGASCVRRAGEVAGVVVGAR